MNVATMTQIGIGSSGGAATNFGGGSGSATNYFGTAAALRSGPDTAGSTGGYFTVSGTSGVMVNTIGPGILGPLHTTLIIPTIAPPEIRFDLGLPLV